MNLDEPAGGRTRLLSLNGLRVFAMLALSASSGSVFVGAGVARRDAQQRFLAERGVLRPRAREGDETD